MDSVAVIGIGNTLMGDDGVGVRIAELLAEKASSGELPASVTVGYMAGMLLMPHVLAAEAVVFVDALAVGDKPGTIYRFDPDEAGIIGLRSTTSHGMGIPYLITNSRLKGHWPTFVVYAVHIGDIMCGPDTLSPEVDAVVAQVADLIAAEVELLAAQDVAPQSPASSAEQASTDTPAPVAAHS